jgi:hypothetical protein
MLLTPAFAPAAGSAAALRNPNPGNYVTDEGWGRLEVKPAEGGVRVSIDARGGNLHTCGLDGLAQAGVLMPDGEQDPGTESVPSPDLGGACRVRFHPFAGGVEVEADDACHGYCGARAWFPGTYFTEPAACQREARARTQSKFDALYKAGRYADAYARLEPQLEACGRFLEFYESGRLRNDLAITLFHLDRKADCRVMIAPVLQGYPRDIDALRSRWGPLEFDDILPLFRSSWHNDALCGGPAAPKAAASE